MLMSLLSLIRDQLAVIQSMRKYEYDFQDIRSQFGASMVLYTDSCHQLLDSLDLTDVQKNDLLVQRSQAAWSEKSLVDAISYQLGLHHKVWLDLNHELHKRIRKLCEKLRLTEEIQVSGASELDELNIY
jgi:hypothetical protein